MSKVCLVQTVQGLKRGDNPFHFGIQQHVHATIKAIPFPCQRQRHGTSQTLVSDMLLADIPLTADNLVLERFSLVQPPNRQHNHFLPTSPTWAQPYSTPGERVPTRSQANDDEIRRSDNKASVKCKYETSGASKCGPEPTRRDARILPARPNPVIVTRRRLMSGHKHPNHSCPSVIRPACCQVGIRVASRYWLSYSFFATI